MNGRRPGHLNKLLPFSLVDGPGNRMVLFLQGCNFDCVACHNPYTITECDSCGVCFEKCPQSALSDGNGLMPLVDWNACDNCEICVEVCPSDSTPLSRFVSVDEILDEIRPVSPFISGITVSGGEATLQADFVATLFTAIKRDESLGSLTTFIDSNGSASRQVWDLLAPVTDGVMVDLKAFDPQTHLDLTGQPNGPVLESIEYLSRLGLLYEVRLLIMPGHNDSEDNIDATAAWLRDIDPAMRIKVIGFRRHGTRPAAAQIDEPGPEQLRAIEARLRDTGFADVAVV